MTACIWGPKETRSTEEKEDAPPSQGNQTVTKNQPRPVASVRIRVNNRHTGCIQTNIRAIVGLIKLLKGEPLVTPANESEILLITITVN
jgi:hypothetical protein